jgi:hypothetical protein
MENSKAEFIIASPSILDQYIQSDDLLCSSNGIFPCVS